MTTTGRCTPSVDQATLQIGLRHQLTRTSEFTLRAGAAAVGTQLSAGEPYTLRAEPSAGATLAHRSRGVNSVTNFRGSVMLSPVISQQTGAVDRRLQGDAAVDWTSQSLLLRGLVRASQSIPADTPGAYLVASLETSVGLRLDQYVTVSLGERLDWQGYASGQSTIALLGYLRVQVASRVLEF